MPQTSLDIYNSFLSNCFSDVPNMDNIGLNEDFLNYRNANLWTPIYPLESVELFNRKSPVCTLHYLRQSGHSHGESHVDLASTWSASSECARTHAITERVSFKRPQLHSMHRGQLLDPWVL